jgi:hypothetical protein
MKLADVQFQPWHTLVDRFYICQSCSWVDTDNDRIKVGTPCKHCGQPSPAARMYSWLNATVLVNAIQDFYFLRRAKPQPDPDGITNHIHTNETDTRVVIPLLFCTLWEVLTTRLCVEILRAKAVDKTLQDRLLLDYRHAREKREKLFLGLTGEKWNDALAELTKSSELNYASHFDFFLNINRKRNAFIHEGSHWDFSDEELEKIPEELWPVFSLFAQLHNRYIPKFLRCQQSCPNGTA